MKYIILTLIFFSAFNLVNAQDNTDSLKKEYYYFFNTNPFNANVIFRDSTLGLTPLRFFSKEKLDGFLLFKKEMFKEKTFRLEEYDFHKGITLDLEPQNRGDDAIVLKDNQTQFNTKRNFYIISGFGAATLSGVMGTIKLKNIANRAYDNYILNQDISELDKSNKYDMYSLITLVVMQAALAGLMYFLFIDK
jgi:hypothetical protein